MTVCVLQSLLTNCSELYKEMGEEAPLMLGALDRFIGSLLAEPEVEVTKSPSGEAPDAKAVLQHIRNALSHPKMKDTNRSATGYTTVKDGSGLVARILFIDRRPENFTIELPVSRLTALAEEVAFVLAQPVMNNWDSADLVPLTL